MELVVNQAVSAFHRACGYLPGHSASSTFDATKLLVTESVARTPTYLLGGAKTGRWPRRVIEMLNISQGSVATV